MWWNCEKHFKNLWGKSKDPINSRIICPNWSVNEQETIEKPEKSRSTEKYIENNKDISITILYNKSYYKKSELETAAWLSWHLTVFRERGRKLIMERVFEAINGVFSFIGPLSDFLWEFPTNFDWYSSIPILGNISFAIILLLGSGIFFSFRIGFMQVK